MNLNSHKSISGSYVDYIKKSPQYIQEIRQLLEEQFVEKLSVQNIQKIDVMVSKWEDDLNSGRQSLDQILLTIRQNKKFKMPWSRWEAISSRD